MPTVVLQLTAVTVMIGSEQSMCDVLDHCAMGADPSYTDAGKTQQHVRKREDKNKTFLKLSQLNSRITSSLE